MSETRARYDLTTGDILKKLLLVAAPVMGSQLMQMSYNLADMFWLGRLSSDAVAASGTAGMFMWLSQAFLIVGRMGAEIGVAQCLGRGEREEGKRYAQNSLFLAAALGVFFALTLILLRGPLVGFFQIQKESVAEDARNYLGIIALSMPLNFIAATVMGIFNGSGNTRTPFLIMATGVVVNMILDPLMIFTLNLGVVGAAVATVLGQALVFLLSVLALCRHRSRPFEKIALFVKPKLAFIRQILKWSVPIGMESLLFTLLAMITSRFVASFGTEAMAVSRVGSQIESLSWLIGGGFGTALTAFVGQNYGAGKWTRIHKGFRISVSTMLVWGVCITAFIFFGGELLFSVFVKEIPVITMGGVYLRILALCQLPQCLEAIAGGAFKGIGRTLPPSVVSVSANVIRVILAYVLSRYTPLGLDGIWWGIVIAATLRGLGSFTWYLIEARKQPKIDVMRVW